VAESERVLHGRGKDFRVFHDRRRKQWWIVYYYGLGKPAQQVPIRLAVQMLKQSIAEGRGFWIPGKPGGKTFDRMMERGFD
jgi:hypothetical protein